MSFSMQPETKDSFKSLSFRGVFEEILLHSTDVFILPIPSTHGCFVCFSFVSIPWIFANVLLAEVLFKLYFLSNQVHREQLKALIYIFNWTGVLGSVSMVAPAIHVLIGKV